MKETSTSSREDEKQLHHLEKIIVAAVTATVEQTTLMITEFVMKQIMKEVADVNEDLKIVKD